MNSISKMDEKGQTNPAGIVIGLVVVLIVVVIGIMIFNQVAYAANLGAIPLLNTAVLTFLPVIGIVVAAVAVIGILSFAQRAA